MKKITLVFFEYPAALHEINAWEINMQNKIVTSTHHKNDRITFHLKNNEIVECFNNDDFSFKEVLKIFTDTLATYNKTLFFGKFELNQLDKIIRLMQTCKQSFL